AFRTPKLFGHPVNNPARIRYSSAVANHPQGHSPDGLHAACAIGRSTPPTRLFPSATPPRTQRKRSRLFPKPLTWWENVVFSRHDKEWPHRENALPFFLPDAGQRH